MKKVNSLDEAQKEMIKDMEFIFKEAMANVCTDAVKGTPKDTGLAQGNWRGSINSPNHTVYKLKSPITTEEIRNQVGNWKIGQTAYFSNPLPYIPPLEYGWSNQAPNGWLRQAAGKGQQAVDKAVKTLQSKGNS